MGAVVPFSVCATSVAVALLSFAVFTLWTHSAPIRLPLHIDGDVHPNFRAVCDAFVQNFADGWERGGASLAVYEKEEKVVDLWGGYADATAMRTWKQDTIQITFSTSKAVASVCVAMLVDRGHLSYDDLVSKYWPEFARNGKDNVTVHMLLSHMAGLIYLDDQLSFEEFMNHTVISRRLEDQRPHWPPGTASGYHVFTMGFLVDQLIRRADPKRRSIGQFIKEELHDAHDIDFHMGLPQEHCSRVARLTSPTYVDIITEMMDTRLMRMLITVGRIIMDETSMLSRAVANLPFFNANQQITVNNPDFWKVEQAAALGMGNARSLAQIFNLLSEGKLVSAKTLNLLREPEFNGTDILIGETTAKGHGFIYERPPGGKEGVIFGHSGHGCQHVYLDLQRGLAIAYTNSGLKVAHSPYVCRTFSRIHEALYRSTTEP